MRVGLIQSNFAPWRGYFDFIADCDLFIYHDDLQYTKGDWRNRNRIKTEKGLAWITAPVRYLTVSQTIEETPIDYTQDWIGRLERRLEASYRKAPFFASYGAPFMAILKLKHETISQLNVAVNAWIMATFGITTPVRMSREFAPAGAKTARILGILKQAGADVYLSGPAARDYLEEARFAENGIRLEYKSYDYPPYPQQFGAFEPRVSVLDMIFNLGAAPREFWKSVTANVLAGREKSQVGGVRWKVGGEKAEDDGGGGEGEGEGER